MNGINREIFRAIHEGKWLSIEYRNKQNAVTKYWIGILSLDIRRRTLRVDGLHLGTLACAELTIYIDSMPYVIGMNRDTPVDLNAEYAAILDMYEQDAPTAPIKAFFGDITSPSRRRKNYPITRSGMC